MIGSPFTQEYRAAAAAHDMAYDTACMTRKEADEMIRDLLIANGVGKVRAGMIYAAVRTGGAIPWKKHREREALIKTNPTYPYDDFV